VNEKGLHAAGFIAYEAATAFDWALSVRQPSDLPLLWFGLYEAPRHIHEPAGSDPYAIGEWLPNVSWDEYRRSIDTIKAHIAAGDTYQVNYTYRLRTQFEGDPLGLFEDLISSQQSSFAAFVDIGSTAICSASPELFFEVMGEEVWARPMKGTARRGRTNLEDEGQAEWLYNSEKNRAENVMIVDMIRNDLGRVCTTGSVCVPKLFETERYPTIWQMTSTVVGRTRAPFVNMMQALFPCASITGAPKVRTMQIIADLETAPRGIYTGCIGYLAPDRRAQFNVAIRTVTIDKKNQMAEYGVGGGIVWDSETADEFEECRTKSKILFEKRTDFRLLESIRWTPDDGYFLLEKHIERLADSAAYFDYVVDISGLHERLSSFQSNLTARPHKVRLLLDRSGKVELQAQAIDEPRVVRVGVAENPVDSDEIFLHHKTTKRAIYDRVQAGRMDCDDVLLWNNRGELTESCNANIVLRFGEELMTPPLESGLLPGTFRRHLLEEGKINERILRIEDLQDCDSIYLINSVRLWREAILAP
jgi:para-aminobenzoate synthetase/4-amino-4-deoxychorismate lyase